MNLLLLIFTIYILRLYILILLFCPLSKYILNKRKTKSSATLIKSNNKLKDSNVVKSKTQLKLIVHSYLLGLNRYILFKVGYIPSHHVRLFIYKYIFNVNIKGKSYIYVGAELRDPAKLNVDINSSIGDFIILDARAGINIGKYVNISSHVSLWSYQHDYNDPYFRCTNDKIGPINIGDRVWIGPNVTILPNITIGEGAVIAAGSVVTKDIPPYVLAGGVPTKIIGERSQKLEYTLGDHIPFY